MNNNELKNQYYDIAREYLDEHCPDLEDNDCGETDRHNAHVALIASHANQIKELRAKTSAAIEKLTDQLKRQKITPEQFIIKMKDIGAIGTIHDLSD